MKIKNLAIKTLSFLLLISLVILGLGIYFLYKPNNFVKNTPLYGILANQYQENLSETKKEILRNIKQDYIGNKPTNEDFTQSEFAGIVGSLNDPYSQYLAPKDLVEFENNLNQKYYGVGIRFDNSESSLVVQEVFENSPASAKNIKVGDILFKVDNETVFGKKIEEIIPKIRGLLGTTVKLEFVRNAGEIINVELVRQEIQNKLIKLEIKNDVAIIKISSFGDKMEEKMNLVAQEILKNPNIKKIALDLRGNGGGLLDAAIDLTSYFVAPGSLVLIEKTNFNQKKYYAKSKKDTLTKYPLVLVADLGSASASEIMMAGIMDNRPEVVFYGQNTFGKGVVQKLSELPNGGVLKLTVAEWLTSKEKPINKLGIAPTKQVKTSEDSLLKAIENK
jgi:carboxyl-terminal processing protease